MIEELSPVYDNVSIEEWADKIHQIKTQELKEVVAKKQAEFDACVEIISPPNHTTLDTALDGLSCGLDLFVLKSKLDILLKHGRK